MKLFLAALLLSTSLAGAASNNVYFDGESSPGKLKDTYGLSSDLTQNGTVVQQTSPAPPNGSVQWIGTDMTPSRSYMLPAASIWGNTFHFGIAFRYVGGAASNQGLVSYENLTTTRYGLWKLTTGNHLSFEYTNSGGTDQNHDSTYTLISGTAYTVETVGSPLGVTTTTYSWAPSKTQVDTFYQSAAPDFGTPSSTKSAIGFEPNSNIWPCRSWVDAYFLSDDTNSVYPPVFTTPTPTITPTWTQTWTPTWTQTVTDTWTPTVTQTITPTWSPTATSTWSQTVTPTWTPTATPTWSQTVTPTWTPTVTQTWTQTVTPTWTPTATSTWTSTVTPTSTRTATLSFTITKTASPTSTATPTPSPTVTATPANCLLLGEATPRATPGALWVTEVFKPVTLAGPQRLKSIWVYIASGSGQLEGALYESSASGWHLVSTSQTFTAVVGWNLVLMSEIATRVLPAGDYLLAIEGSDSLKAGSRTPGNDLLYNTQWSHFPSIVSPRKGYVDFSIYGNFCNY